MLGQGTLKGTRYFANGARCKGMVGGTATFLGEWQPRKWNCVKVPIKFREHSTSKFYFSPSCLLSIMHCEMAHVLLMAHVLSILHCEMTHVLSIMHCEMTHVRVLQSQRCMKAVS